MRGRLRVLGMPDEYLPRGRQPSIDALARALGTLPGAPPLPHRAGSVVVVVGRSEVADRSADILRDDFGLGRRDVVRCTVEPDDPDAPKTTRAAAEASKVRVGVRVARRRATGTTSLVAIGVPPSGDPTTCADLIECLRPDYVLAAVDASVKRTDLEHWLEGVGPVDALAVWGLADTTTPAELLGVAPIAYTDGTACSALGWTATLLARLADEPA